MKKAKVDRLFKEAYSRGHNAGREVGRIEGSSAERRKQTEYFRASEGTFDLAPPPSSLYREIVLSPESFRETGMQTVRVRAVANVIQVGNGRFAARPHHLRFFTWELCG